MHLTSIFDRILEKCVGEYFMQGEYEGELVDVGINKFDIYMMVYCLM